MNIINYYQLYQRFINNLGWTPDLLRHQGFNGAMNATTTGRYAKYCNTATYEMAFHIATNAPTILYHETYW